MQQKFNALRALLSRQRMVPASDIPVQAASSCRAADIYAVEMREGPHPHSLKASNTWSACAGMEAAEGFVLGRHLNIH